MRWILTFVFAVHGLIHLMGFAKAFGYAELPQLTQPISRAMGVVWLAASMLMVATAVSFAAWPRSTALVGTIALILSQVAIATAWRDAWAGTIANLMLVVVLVYGWPTQGR